jgi:hypothetical protein
MEVTSLYWRQLYLYLSRQQRRQSKARKRLVQRVVAETAGFRPGRPLVVSSKRPFSAPN